MDARELLKAQIDALMQEINRAERILKSQAIDNILKYRVFSRFSQLIERKKSEIINLQREFNDHQSLDCIWDSFQLIYQDCQPIFRECLALMQGSLVRSAGLDDGLCQIADSLLDKLSYNANIPWNGFTILAETDFFTESIGVIRLYFPGVSIWNLSIAGHELGHFVANELRVQSPNGYRYPFQELVQRENRGNPNCESYLREIFSDLFATYTLGPAYAFACLILRFDPIRANQDGTSHPSFTKRIYLILKMLEKMDGGQGLTRNYGFIVSTLKELWNNSINSSTSQGPVLDILNPDFEQQRVQLDFWLDELYSLLSDLPGSSRYSGWLNAQRLSPGLLLENSDQPQLRDEDEISDILNAAWLARFSIPDQNSYAIRQIERKAITLCNEIIRRRQ